MKRFRAFLMVGVLLVFKALSRVCAVSFPFLKSLILGSSLILYGINETILPAIRRSSLGFQVRFLDAKDGPLEPSNYF